MRNRMSFLEQMALLACWGAIAFAMLAEGIFLPLFMAIHGLRIDDVARSLVLSVLVEIPLLSVALISGTYVMYRGEIRIRQKDPSRVILTFGERIRRNAAISLLCVPMTALTTYGFWWLIVVIHPKGRELNGFIIAFGRCLQA